MRLEPEQRPGYKNLVGKAKKREGRKTSGRVNERDRVLLFARRRWVEGRKERLSVCIDERERGERLLEQRNEEQHGASER